VEEISQDEREKIREEERRKIMKEMKKEKHASYSSHDSCKSLSEELSNYYRGHHSSHTKHHFQRKEKDRRRQVVNISLPYFHGKDNVEAYLDWEMKVEQLFACHLSQPTLRREGDTRLAGCEFHERNTHGVATNVYLRKTSEKPEKTRSTNF